MPSNIECPSESIVYICRHLKNGRCTLGKVKMEFELQSDRSMNHWIVCSNEDIITNGMPEWKYYKDNRTERYK